MADQEFDFRKRAPRGGRRTYAVYLNEDSMEGIESLLDQGVYVNRSQAIDEAIRLLLDSTNKINDPKVHSFKEV